MRRLGRELFTRRGLVLSFFFLRVLLIFLGGVAYLLMPFDLIPESVVGVLGFLDDALIFLFGALMIAANYRARLLQMG